MQAMGAEGLAALDAGALHRLARLYWYSVEFGLAREDGETRIYGAGLLSSFGESRFALESDSAAPAALRSSAGAAHPLPLRTPSSRPISSSTASRICSACSTTSNLADLYRALDGRAGPGSGRLGPNVTRPIRRSRSRRRGGARYRPSPRARSRRPKSRMIRAVTRCAPLGLMPVGGEDVGADLIGARGRAAQQIFLGAVALGHVVGETAADRGARIVIDGALAARLVNPQVDVARLGLPFDHHPEIDVEQSDQPRVERRARRRRARGSAG